MTVVVGKMIITFFSLLAQIIQLISNSFLLPTDTGIGFKGINVSNHGVIRRDFIGINENALYCVTNTIHCGTTSCLPVSDGSSVERGHWYFPSGNPVQFSTEHTGRWYGSWINSAVILNYRGDGNDGATGLFRCNIKDYNNKTRDLYTCIWDDLRTDFQCEVHNSV